MNTDFRIGLISDDPYHSGLLKGYCQAHRYKIFETAVDKESINTMIQMQPNIIILAIGLAQDRAQKNNFDLIRQISINHQIPVCYLRDVNNAANSGEDPACWVDTTLDAPLNINQLNDYLHSKFKHHHLFIQEKRNRERRTANDRRLLMLNQQNKVPGNNHPANKNMPHNDDTDCFTVEPFQIDQRSKSVFFNGKLLNLTRKEFELFELLAKDIDRVFMTDEIINHLWPDNNRATKSDLYQYMHLLRKKIENDPNNPQWILTVKGFGYKLNMAEPAKMN
ncbi:response regulator transcription factor [Methylobacter tundripaludum]|uniref:response regulator transcription factor n=1 Tax=Methylobacter tundripaludum TaxID=173365 RepID=UPI00068D7E10|nr:response regulator transcription factor [Methylobacter tundripaludum]